MAKIHNNDISIGKDKWIFWIETDPGQNSYDIDSSLKPTLPFWKLLETECVSACCGIHAFGFWTEDLENAKQQLNDTDIKQKFEKLRHELFNKAERLLSSAFLNNLFDRKVFIQLLDHIIYNL